ncbi:MAG: hypothetical protein U1F43_11300 [Myxococcota bacterium]
MKGGTAIAWACWVGLGCGPGVSAGADATAGADTAPQADATAPVDTMPAADASAADTTVAADTTSAVDSTVAADTTPADAVTSTPLRDKARALAEHLTGRGDFMVGLGNDNDGPWADQVPLDLHYAYLVGYGGSGGWPDWNAGGDYPVFFAQTALEHGATPMYTYYQLALELENGADAVLGDSAKMGRYLADVRLLYTKLAALDRPAVVGFEPDFFGYLMQRAASGSPPEDIVARIHVDAAGECADLPETVVGLTRCVIRMARALAPKLRVGFHASMWGAWYDVLDPSADVEASGRAVGDFLKRLGGDEADFVGVETLDRDAGFWETSGGGASCSLHDGSRGPVYWDADNVTLPNFAQHLRWVSALTATLGVPALWWQTPLGVPADSCGGSDEHWRDNRVSYFFSHVADLVAAGGAGMTFGTGAGGQTHLGTDDGQFKRAAVAYRAAPFHL